MLEKLKAKIGELEIEKHKIITDLKEGRVPITFDGIVEAGKKLEIIRAKIWAIEEAMYQ